MEQVRNHSYTRLVTTDKERYQLVSEPNYHTTKRFSEDLIAVKMKKSELKMNKPIYLDLEILDISRTLMYEFWYDYLEPKHDNNIGLLYRYDSFIFHVETEDIYKDISNDVDTRFDTSASSIDLNTPLPIGKNKNVLRMMKNELCGKIVTEFVALRTKTYSYLDYDGKEKKKAEGTKKCVIKNKIKFDEYKMCLFNNNLVLRSQEVFKNEFHDVYTLQRNKIVLSSNDDKRLQTYVKITTYPYGCSVGKVCKIELLNIVKLLEKYVKKSC